MRPFNRKDYLFREIEEVPKILKEEIKGIGDKDINNLKLILYSIKPCSYWFRRGCIRSLRKAIKLLEKQKGDDAMPSIEHMRSAISDAYPGEGWKFRCEHMHANQVIAIYGSLMKRGVFDSSGERGFVAYRSSKNSVRTAKDAPANKFNMVEPSGESWVQLSMF